jgi:histidine triad (HIT) family protein
MPDRCDFCEIVAGRAPATIVAENHDHDAIAIVPLDPVVDGHVIVLPREHITDAADDPWAAGDVMVLAGILAREHQAANIITSIGAAATQTVFHLHIHVVPRVEGDGLTLPWTGQQRGEVPHV